MPSVIFHVRGKKLSPEVELAKTTLKPYSIHHLGEVVIRKRGDFVFEDSGFHVDIGPQNSEDLKKQTKIATSFVKKHYSEIKRIKGASDMRLDFGYCMRFDKTGEPFWVQTDFFPLEFVRLCGELKIGIELSMFYGATVDRLISHYVKVLKLKRPETKRAAEKRK